MPSRASTDDSTSSAEQSPLAIERVLAVVIVICMGTALIGFILSLVQVGMKDTWTWLAEGPWPYAFLLPVYALPAGFVSLLALLGISMFRKSRSR